MKKDLLILFLLTTLVVVGFALYRTISFKQKQVPDECVPEVWYDCLLFKNKGFSYQLAETMGCAYAQGADIGECIATAREIKEGDFEDWYQKWLQTGNRLKSYAEKWEKAKNYVASKQAYLRASNYYRQAGFYMNAPENRHKSVGAWKLSRESFLRALAYLPHVEFVEIPYENTTLPAYFIKSEKVQNDKAPVIIVHTGFDGAAEGLYFEVAVAAADRGYHCLIFEGPGQGEVLRMKNIPFRHDWEHVASRVIDYVLTRPEVSDKIAIMGISIGGYFAPRAAAFDKRIEACIANGGVYSVREFFSAHFPPEGIALLESNPAQFDNIIYERLYVNPYIRWFFENGMWTFDASSPSDLMEKLKQFTLQDVVKNITCPTLIVDSEEDAVAHGQAKKLYNALGCPKDYLLFTKEEGADAHCQIGATALSNEKIFNWLDRVFKKKR